MRIWHSGRAHGLICVLDICTASPYHRDIFSIGANEMAKHHTSKYWLSTFNALLVFMCKHTSRTLMAHQTPYMRIKYLIIDMFQIYIYFLFQNSYPKPDHMFGWGLLLNKCTLMRYGSGSVHSCKTRNRIALCCEIYFYTARIQNVCIRRLNLKW